MTRFSGLLDPESAAIVVAATDAATSPRRQPRAVRFTDPVSEDPTRRCSTRTVSADPAPAPDDRTREQLAVDALVDLSGCSPRGSGSRSPRAMADAGSPSASGLRRGARRITSGIGTETEDAPTPPMGCPCADTTTSSSTTTDGGSSATAAATPPSLPRRSIRAAHPCEWLRRARSPPAIGGLSRERRRADRPLPSSRGHGLKG